VRHNYFDTDVAETYDEGSAGMFAPDVLGPTVDLLVELADGKAALELAIGTGRVALPLSARGVHVHGIELSETAAAHLEPGGVFVVEKSMPIVRRLPPGERYAVFNHTDEQLGIDEYDTATQLTWSHHYSSDDGTTYRCNSVPSATSGRPSSI
jgi:hypothetical protein